MLNRSKKISGIIPEQLVNTCRRFGRFGPVYQIMSISHKLENGDILMKIHVFESNEDIEYPLSNILDDLLETN